MQERRFATVTVHAGDEPGAPYGTLEPPIVMSSAFAFESAEDAAARFSGAQGAPVYGRWSNPTVGALESKVAALEGAEAAVAFASGMAAVHGAVGAFVSAGDEIIAATSLYAETTQLLRGPFARFGVKTHFVAGSADAVGAAMSASVRVVYLETPANPTLALVDVGAVKKICEDRARVVVDSTMATPFHQTLLDNGADLVLHSATKGLCGHGDAIGGVVVGRQSDVDLVRRFGVRGCGATMSPFTAMMIHRGMRTLGVRMAHASASAAELARRLSAHPKVERVHYPGLTTDPGHEIATRQMRRGYGALVAFVLRGGAEAGARAYDALELITRAVSLGDVRSLLTHPASTTHVSLSSAERAAAGIDPGLLRLSVGVEDVEDLWEDLERALAG